MEIEALLKELIQQEETNMKKYILFMLLKFSHCVKETTSADSYLPLVLVQNGRITLIYRDQETDGFEYIFTEYEEILILLQKLFSDNETVYFCLSSPTPTLSTEEIADKIDEAIANNDEAQFNHYAALLNNER